MATFRSRSRSGALLYSMVVANSVIVGLLGLAALMVVRVERRASGRFQEIEAAQMLAWTGLELGVRELAENSNWRTGYVHNIETTPLSFAGGTVSWQFLDTTDSDLADDAADAVTVHGIGRIGDAAWVHAQSFQLLPISPLDHALHAQGMITINSDDQLTATSGTISTNGTLTINGTLVGSAECLTKTGTGSATGTVEEDAPVKGLPAFDVFASYVALATALPYVGSLDKDVLAPGVNSYAGGLNTDGVYYINTGGNEITIKDSRIYGTLVILGNCKIDNTALLHSYRADYPTLIVSGYLYVTTDSQTESLSEDNSDRNFNPVGAPYSGVTDSDENDFYPNELRGLVHVIGNLTLDRTARVRGVVICEGQATITGDNNELIYDAAVAAAPPVGYDIVDYVLTRQSQTARRAAAP